MKTSILISLLFITLQFLGLKDVLAFNEAHSYSILTSHFVHLGWHHVFLNILGLFSFVLLSEGKYKNLELLAMVLFAALFIGVGMVMIDYSWYVGFSAILYALYVVYFWQEKGNYVGQIGLALIVCKVIYEHFWMSQQYEAFLGGRVAIEIHLIGIMAGFSWVILKYIKNTLAKKGIYFAGKEATL